MKLICLLLILYVIPLYAQDECDYKLYVDTLHGFSMKIPRKQKIEKISYETNTYRVKMFGEFQYKFYLESKDRLLSSLGNNVELDSSDILLSMAENKCYFSLKSRGDRAEGYGRLDSLIQWTNDYNIRIIEIQRTQVFKVFDGSFEYEKVGPLFLIKLITGKGEFFLSFDFYDYYDYEAIMKIISSIKVIQ